MKRGDPEYRAHIATIVDSFPPLTAEDSERLAVLWRPGAEVMWKVIREREAAVARPAREAVARPSRGAAT
jgi:hypothetical protein